MEWNKFYKATNHMATNFNWRIMEIVLKVKVDEIKYGRNCSRMDVKSFLPFPDITSFSVRHLRPIYKEKYNRSFNIKWQFPYETENWSEEEGKLHMFTFPLLYCVISAMQYLQWI